MTDLDKFKELCKGFGLDPAAEARSDSHMGGREPFPPQSHFAVAFQQGDKKVEGYLDFFSVWYFTPDGEFLGIGNWE